MLGDFRLTLGISTEVEQIPYAVIINGAWTDYYSVRQRAPEHLALVRRLGMGVHLNELSFEPKHLVQAVKRVLSTPGYRESAQQQAKSLAAYDGPKHAAEIIHRTYPTPVAAGAGRFEVGASVARAHTFG